MLWSEMLLADAQGAPVERLGFRMLALLRVEGRQAVERVGYQEMLWSEALLQDA